MHGRKSSPPGTLMTKKRGVRYDRECQERTRQKLYDSGVLDIALKALRGEVELNSSQTAIALKCMDKLVPNLAQVEQEITQNVPFAVIPQQSKDAKAWESSVTKAPETPTEARTATKPPGQSPSTLKH